MQQVIEGISTAFEVDDEEVQLEEI